MKICKWPCTTHTFFALANFSYQKNDIIAIFSNIAFVTIKVEGGRVFGSQIGIRSTTHNQGPLKYKIFYIEKLSVLICYFLLLFSTFNITKRESYKNVILDFVLFISIVIKPFHFVPKIAYRMRRRFLSFFKISFSRYWYAIRVNPKMCKHRLKLYQYPSKLKSKKNNWNYKLINKKIPIFRI